MPRYERPSFWRVPHQRMDPENEPRDFGQRRKVTPGTPAGRELVRGDIIAKIDDYDTRDVRHEDAQNLFRNAPQQIKLVVQRDVDRDGPRNTAAARAPRSPIPFAAAQYRTPSPQQGWRGLDSQQSWRGQDSQNSWRGQDSQNSWRGPESLPRTPLPHSHGPVGPAGLPHYNSFPPQIEGEYRTLLLSPSSMRTDDTFDESIQIQPYRTTPLVLPGAKVRREPGPTESYLRHHPNPSMRAPPSHDYRDTLMRQRVAHKQFNSPINLYSDQNIANSIRQQTSPLPANGHYGRPHVVKRQVFY